MASKVKTGGPVGIACFYEGVFAPCSELFFDCIERFGVQRPPLRWEALATETRYAAVFRQAGLEEISVTRQQLGYILETPEEWWALVWNAGFRNLVEQLRPEDLARFKHEHLAEIGSLHTEHGIWLELEVLHSRGLKQ